MMRTTIDIHDPLLERAKALAAASGRRLTDIVNDALLEMLNRRDAQSRKQDRIEIPVFDGSESGGLQPGVDPTSNASYLEAMDQEALEPQKGAPDVTKMN